MAAACAETVAVIGGTIIDPASSGPKRKATIIITGDKIRRIGQGLAIPIGARVIDARGKFIVPGLWDMHAHLAALTETGVAPEHYVAYGVLGVRDMGGYMDKLIALRADIGAGKRIGPDIIMAGPTLNGPPQPAPFHRVVATDAEARLAVRELKAAGVDFIKIHRRITREAFLTIADETKKLKLDFAGHVPLVMSWVEGASGGMRTIEHIQTIYENLQPDPKKLIGEFPSLQARLQGAEGEAIWAAMAKARTHLTPTLVGYEDSIDKSGPEVAELRKQAYAAMRALMPRAIKAGVPMLAGTDVLERHGEMLLRELELLVEVGLSPREALAAGTTTPAEAMGLAGPGRIAAGAPASLLIVDADPTVAVANLRKLSLVILRGRVLETEDLAALKAATTR